MLGDILFSAPAAILIAAFVLLPILIAFYLSFTDWDGFTPNPDFVGWENYTDYFTDGDVVGASVFTVIVAIVATISCNAVGLALALAVNGASRFNSAMRAVLFYPFVLGAVIIGFLWSAILGSNGAINALLESLSADKVPFLSDPLWAAASVIFVIVWSHFGINMVLYLAGLQTIPESLIEAATIDGAGPWAIFWKVKLPLLAPVVTINIVLVMVSFLRTYELVLALTNGGPAGRTQTVVYHILSTSFRNGELGYGAAQSIVLMIVIVAVAAGISAYRRRAEKDVIA
jgi:ABC-type sugar transport system permease subunit